MGAENDPSQQRVLEFLAQASSYDDVVPVREESSFLAKDVQVINTHSATVFLIRDDVFKIKRSIAFSYLDMSTLEERHRLCVRELALNRQTLPDIYLAVVPVSEKKGGGLAIGGQGKPVEWAIHMRRFSESRVLDRMASAGQLTNQLAKDIGGAIAQYHEKLPEWKCKDGYARINEVVNELIHELNALTTVFIAATVDAYGQQLHTELNDCSKLLDERANSGFVKRCHGDLHLRNLVMHKGIPAPFDALEFNERMATTDVLYDLAFLIMDIDHRDLHDQANRVLNQYLLHSDVDNLRGLRLLPVFLSCRACIRAMTTAQAIAANPAESSPLTQEAMRYLDLAVQYLESQSPVLIAIGGLSGTGKTTVAMQLAPLIGQHPGAVILRSDAERKIAEGVTETTRLPDELYSRETSKTNYDLLQRKSKLVLEAGSSVIVDAVFLDARQRDAIEQCARECGCEFIGFWLTADVPLLEQRIDARVDDASDATVEVLNKQRMFNTGVVHWSVVNSGTSREEVLAEAKRLVYSKITH